MYYAIQLRLGCPAVFNITYMLRSLSIRERVSQVLESYVLRRAVCTLPTNNYNKIFLSLATE
jgi:hypothetical protein